MGSAGSAAATVATTAPKGSDPFESVSDVSPAAVALAGFCTDAALSSDAVCVLATLARRTILRTQFATTPTLLSNVVALLRPSQPPFLVDRIFAFLLLLAEEPLCGDAIREAGAVAAIVPFLSVADAARSSSALLFLEILSHSGTFAIVTGTARSYQRADREVYNLSVCFCVFLCVCV